jgi:hypothetical protein
LLQKAVSEKNKSMSPKGISMHPIPALKTLLDTSWKALAEASARQQADRILKNTTGISTLGDRSLAKHFCLQWQEACPSCFQCDFDNPMPAIGPVFSCLQPSVERASIVLHDCDVLDDMTGEVIKKEIHIDVISCAPLMSSADSDVFKFRAADESKHTNYSTFILAALPCTDRKEVEYWQLIRSIGSDSQALSFIRIGCLNPIINNKVRQLCGIVVYLTSNPYSYPLFLSCLAFLSSQHQKQLRLLTRSYVVCATRAPTARKIRKRLQQLYPRRSKRLDWSILQSV